LQRKTLSLLVFKLSSVPDQLAAEIVREFGQQLVSEPISLIAGRWRTSRGLHWLMSVMGVLACASREEHVPVASTSSSNWWRGDNGGAGELPYLDEDEIQRVVTPQEDQVVGTFAVGCCEQGDADFHVDRMALDAICSVVPAEMIAILKPT
jgi:hypothetical protein